MQNGVTYSVFECLQVTLPIMEGKLFSQNFLTQGIVETKPWRAINSAEFEAFKQALEKIFQPYDAASQLNEANTEAEIIVKVLDLLG